MSISRSEIAGAIAPQKQHIDVSELVTKLGYSNTNPVESFNVPGAAVQVPYGGIKGRQDMIDALMARRQPSGVGQGGLFQMTLQPVEQESGGGVFDVPVLGFALDLLDTPRAMVVSAVKEVGDLFGEGDASFSDWVKQSNDNIMMGEVLRDWGVDLPGPLDFIVGLGLDIALDPLMYAAGAGLIARAAGAPAVARNLSARIKAAEIAVKQAPDAATAAREATRARELTDLFDVVRTEGVTAGTAANPALMREMGIWSGLHIIMPGTGRIGRRIIERPLGSVVPSLGERAARRRVNQLAEAPWLVGDEGFDVAANADAIVARMRGGDLPGSVYDDAIEKAARRASQLPISVALGGARTQRVTSQALGFVGGGVGRAVTRASQLSKADKMLRTFNSKGALIAAKRGQNSDIARMVFDMERLGNRAALSALRWNKQTTDELDRLIRDLQGQGIKGEDLDQLMFYAATSTDEELISNPAFARWVSFGADGSAEVSPFVRQAQEWWKSAGRRAGIPEEQVSEFFYAARMRDDIRFKRGGGTQVDPDVDGIPLDGRTLSGTPTTQRRLMTPAQIKQRLLSSEGSSPSIVDQLEDVRSASPEARAYQADVERLKSKVEASKDTKKPKTIEQVMDEELADGVRYGEGQYISTNVYAGQALDNSSILTQMDEIARQAGDDVDPKKLFKFSDDASAVLPRYIGLMTKNVRSETMLRLAQNEGMLLPGSRFQKGRLAQQIEGMSNQLRLVEQELGDARQALIDSGMNEAEVANALADIAKRDNVTDAAAWLKSTDGQLAAQLADMQVQIDTLNQVLRAASDGVYYSKLSPDARRLLDDAGWRDAATGPYTKQQKAQIQRLAADSEARLAALADATEFLHELQLIAGRLRTQRDQLGAVLNQLETGRNVKTGGRLRPATVRTMLETQAAQLDEVFEQLKYISGNIRGNLEAFDPTLVAGRGLAALGDPALLERAQRELFEEMIGVWAATDDLRRVAQTITDLPADGRLVSIDWKGGSIGWDIRWKAQPLAGLGDRRTLRTLMGEERADYMARILAVLDDSPAGRAQAAVLETMENIRLMQNRLGNIVPGRELIDAVEEAIGDAETLAKVLREQGKTDLDLMIDSFLDQRLGMARRPPAVKKTMDDLRGQTARIEAEIQAKVAEVQEIFRTVKNKGDRRVLLAAALFDGPNSLTMRRNAARKAAKKGDTVAALNIAENPAEALKAVARGQGNAAFVDNYLEGAEAVVADMLLHTFKVGADDTFAPTVGNVTRSKLTGQSFVAPLSAGVTREQTREMAMVFSEVFEAMARTADPAQLAGWARGASRLANWWKAQAVGTPGFVMRNMLGAAWMNNQLAGMPMTHMPRVVRIRDAALKAGNGDVSAGLRVLIEEAADPAKRLKMSRIAGGGRVDVRELKTFQQWYDSGIAAGTGGRGIDIRSAVNEGLVEEGRGFRSGFGSGTWKPTADFKPFTAIRGWNADVEFMARGSLAHHVMMGGGDLDDALGKVYKYHFDYTDLTAAEVKAKTFIPFWTWQRRALPLLIESVGSNPQAWNRISQLKGEMELQSEQEGLVPDYFGENMGIRLPFSIGGYRAYSLPSLPFSDLANWAKAFDTDQPDTSPLDAALNFARPAMESAIPHFRYPIEHLMGVRTFNQVPFRDQIEPAPDWAKIPVLAQALDIAGLATRSREGNLLMTDRHRYAVEQFIPVFANWSRLDPAEDPEWSRSDAAKQIATMLNFTIGLGIRVNTPKEKRNERLRQMYTDAADRRRQEALAEL